MTTNTDALVCPAAHERWAVLTDDEREAWYAGYEWGYRDGESNREADIDILIEQIGELRAMLAAHDER
jgi:hypothetical protein